MNVFGDIKINDEPKRIKLKLGSPFEVFKRMYHDSDSSFLLESMESDSGLSRYSMIGFRPIAIIRARENFLEIENGNETHQMDIENPFEIIKELIKHGKGKKGFRGGLVGYVSYEAARHFEP
ncbi:MAG: anthranilate synthase component I, partial [Methanobacteriaceae archaeon]|nr:anthranilate synthase component I [Methanobacteriaceae archaeon]